MPAAGSFLPPAGAVRAEQRVPTFLYWTYLALFLVSLVNIVALVDRGEENSLPLNPMAFVAAGLLIVPLTRGKSGLRYFPAAWTFVGLFAVLGLLGPKIPEGMTAYYLAQRMFKIWITVIGFPWLATRALRSDTLSKLVKIAVVVSAAGAAFACAQVAYPAQLGFFSSEPGRGAGFWINPNNCGAICTLFLFASLVYPFRTKSLNLILRAILVAGVFASLSRASILMFLAGSIAYGITSGRTMTIFKIGVALVVALAVGLAGLNVMASRSESVARRVESLKEILTGKIESSKSARTSIWTKAMEEIGSDWFIGRGHGSMERLVRIGSGLGPHNYYIYVLGNSGIIALLAFLAWLAILARNALAIKHNPSARAGLVAMAAVVAGLAVFDHSLLAHQFMGPVFAVMALSAYYSRIQPQAPPMPPRGFVARA